MTGDELYTLRFDVLAMTQAELGDLLGLHHSAISLMESGKRRIDRRTELALRAITEEHANHE